MVGHLPLREIIGSDALRLAIAGTDLRSPLLRAFVASSCWFLAHRGCARRKSAIALGAVAMLGALLLHRDHHAGRQVGDADRRFGLVDMLAAGRPDERIGVDLEIGLVDLEVGSSSAIGSTATVRGRGGWIAPLGLGRRHALHPMDAALELEPGENAAARHFGNESP